MITAAEAVANGAQLLDEKQPGWYRHINIEELRIASTCKCICGQLGSIEGEFWSSYTERLGLRRASWNSPEMEALSFAERNVFHQEWVAALRMHGFDSGNGPTYPELDAEWKLAIQARLDADALIVTEPIEEKETVYA